MAALVQANEGKTALQFEMPMEHTSISVPPARGRWLVSIRNSCSVLLYSRNTPYCGASIGVLSEALNAIARAVLVSAGSRMPSSQISEVA